MHMALNSARTRNLYAPRCEHEPSSHLEESADLGAFQIAGASIYCELEPCTHSEEIAVSHARRKVGH
jgi:hypothetical protein